jgi:hypothetical protein
MPTAPDNSWTSLLDRLADNNFGDINEEDVRCIARFCRPSYAVAGASGVSPSTYWQPSSLPAPTETTVPQYALLLAMTTPSGPYSYERGENYLSPASNGFTYSGNGGGDVADAVAASRLVHFSWNIELFATTLEHCAISWWSVPVASTGFPNLARRHRIGRMYTQSAWNGAGEAGVFQQFKRGNTVGYITASDGSGSLVMNPGDLLVPLIEHYGPTNTVANAKLSFQLSAHTVGVVDAWTPATTTDGYWDTSGDLSIDKVGQAPFTFTPPAPRSYGTMT